MPQIPSSLQSQRSEKRSVRCNTGKQLACQLEVLPVLFPFLCQMGYFWLLLQYEISGNHFLNEDRQDKSHHPQLLVLPALH